MTAVAEAKMSEKEAAKEALKVRAAEMESEEKKLNEGRSGKGTRVFLGMTRGRNPQKIQYEAFDESQPDTLPKTLSEFMDISKVSAEEKIVAFLIDGYNSDSYVAASDPVAEFVEPTWDDDFKVRFRTTIRNYSVMTGLSIEDTVNLLKPQIVAGLAKK